MTVSWYGAAGTARPLAGSRRGDAVTRTSPGSVNLTYHIRPSIRNWRNCWSFMTLYAIMFEEQTFCRTDVVHAFGAGSRGPRVGRGSRLAGPRPGRPGGPGGVAGPAVRAGRRPVRRPAGVLGRRGLRAAARPGRADRRGAGRDLRGRRRRDARPGCRQRGAARPRPPRLRADLPGRVGQPGRRVRDR